MQKLNAPLYNALEKYIKKSKLSLHVPGHKNGTSLPEEVQQAYGRILQFDVTELPGTDDLHEPSEAILEAQSLAATCFGAEHTFFLVGGSTVGNLAMISAVCKRDELLIVQRNVHKSVLHGLQLRGVRAVFLSPELDPQTGLAGLPSLENVCEALKRYPEAKGVFLNSPNYYGCANDLTAYAEAIHAAGLPVLVDEAHGAHYGFHKALPKSALQAGADVVVQSAHKTLTAMTMGAMLHLQGERVAKSQIASMLSILQSSSPSYPIMASLDIARAILDEYGESWFLPGLKAASYIRERLQSLQWQSSIALMTPGSSFDSYDPLRVTIYDSTEQLTGYEVYDRLVQRGIYGEMADVRYAVLLLGARTTLAEADLLLSELERISPAEPNGNVYNNNSLHISLYDVMISEPLMLELTMLDADGSRHQEVQLSEAVNLRSAEMIIPYPPGIPILFPGELVTESMVHYLLRLKEAGARFQGWSTKDENKIRVVKQ